MSEIIMGTVLLVWLSGPTSGRPEFGYGGSIGVVTTGMALLAVAMFMIAIAPRLGRRSSLTAVIIASLTVVSVGAVSFVVLLDDPGVGFLLGFGWALSIPVLREITRFRSIVLGGERGVRGR